MSLGTYFSDTFIPIIDFILSLADQVLGLMFTLQLLGVSIGGLAITVAFFTFVAYRVLSDD